MRNEELAVALQELVTIDTVHAVLEDIAEDKPHLLGALPRASMAKDIATKAIWYAFMDMEEPEEVARCECMETLHPSDIQKGYCSHCTRTITIRFGRPIT